MSGVNWVAFKNHALVLAEPILEPFLGYSGATNIVFKVLHMGHNPRNCYLPPNCGVLGVVRLHVITHGGTPPLPSQVTLLIVSEEVAAFIFSDSQLSYSILSQCLSFRVPAGKWKDKSTWLNMNVRGWGLEACMNIACVMQFPHMPHLAQICCCLESHKNQPRLTGSGSPELGFQNIGDAASKAKNEMHWEDIFDIFCHGQISMIWGGQLRI